MEYRKYDSVVGGFVVNKKGQLLLVDHKIMNKWVPFGGHIKELELPHQALKREGREELPGLNFRFLQTREIPIHFNISYHEMVSDNHTPYNHEHFCINYLCTNLNNEFSYNKEELNGYCWHDARSLKTLDRIPNPLRSLSLDALRIGMEILNS